MSEKYLGTILNSVALYLRIIQIPTKRASANKNIEVNLMTSLKI